jgi:hypothetical protein
MGKEKRYIELYHHLRHQKSIPGPGSYMHISNLDTNRQYASKKKNQSTSFSYRDNLSKMTVNLLKKEFKDRDLQEIKESLRKTKHHVRMVSLGSQI